MSIGTKYLKITALAYLAVLPMILFGQVTVNVTANQPSCFGWTNGSATAMATGGTAPYSYRWSNGQAGGATMLGVAAGTFTVTATDATNRTATSTFVIGQPTKLIANFFPQGGSCGVGSVFVGSGSGGIAPYTYTWRNLSNGQMFNGALLQAPTQGTYHLSVTDANSCVETRVVTVTEALDVRVVTGDVQCNGMGNGRAQALVSGGLPPFRFNWSNGGTTETITNLSGGNFIVTVTDANGCQTFGFGTVNEPFPVKLNAQTFDLCGNNRVKISPVGGTLPHTVLWSNGALGYDVRNFQPGNHFVLLIDAKGCKDSFAFKVGRSDNPNITVSSINAGCAAGQLGSATVNLPNPIALPVTYRWSNGATTPSVSGLAAGTYTVTVTDGAGCVTTKSVVITTVTPINSTINTTNSECNSATGTATVTNVTGGSGGYTYRWSNGSTSNSTGGLAVGQHILTITDNGGCTSIRFFNISPIRTVEFTLTSTNSICGGATGTATITNPVGGTAPYTYRWSNGATTPSVSGLAPGFYMATVTDAGGCEGKQSFTINGVSNMVVTATITNSTCTGATGALAVNVANGTAPFTYTWGDVTSNVSNRTGLRAGTYNVTVTDRNGCTGVASFRVLGMGNFTIATAKTDANCGQTNGSVSVTNVTGGTAPYTYLWSNGATTAALTNIAGGIYTVTVTDNAGCNGVASVTVNAIGNFTVTTDITKSDCVNPTGSIRITNVTGGTAAYTYLWSNGTTGPNLINVAAGVYSVTIRDANGCLMVLSNLSVGTNSTLAATATTRNSTCGQANGGITILPTGGSVPYTFRSGAGFPNNLRAGSYTVTVTDAGGCTFILPNITVKDTGSVKAQFAVTPQSCANDSVLICFANNSTGLTTGATYQWNFTGNRTSTVASPCIRYGGIEGESRLIITSNLGCKDTLLLRFPVDNIVVDLADTVVTCENTPVTVTVNNLNTASTLKYRWSTSANDTLRSLTVTPTTGISTYRVTITNGTGCIKVDSVKVVAVPRVLNPADVVVKQDCDTTLMTFTILGAAGRFYRWDFGDTNSTRDTASGSPVSYLYPRSGTFTVTLTPLLGCLNSATIPINVRAGKAVTVDATNDTTVCSTAPFTIRATSNANNFEWFSSRPLTQVIGTGATLLARPSATSGRDTMYYVRSRNADGCIGLDSVIIRNRAIAVNINRQINLCKDVNTTILATSGSVVSVKWTPASIIVGSDSSLSVVVKAATSGNLIGTFRNAAGCTLTDTVRFTVIEFDAKATASATTIYKDDVITLSATPTGTGFRYSWTPTANVNTPTNASTTATPQATTTYVVEVTDPNGCKDTGRVTITVLEPFCDEPFVFIPRAFSPNGDGTNEKVYVRGDYLKDTNFEFAIYNRWGERVFFTTDRKEGWDGTHQGMAVCPDVYGYYVKAVCRKDEAFFKKGNITVLK